MALLGDRHAWPLRPPRIVGSAAVVLLCAIESLAQTPQPQAFFGITPGSTTKAQVDLAHGDPLRRVSATDAEYEYAAPRGDLDSSRIVIGYDDDTLQVARIDAYVKQPFPADAVRSRFGTRVIARDRSDGGREELYFPQLQGLVFASRDPHAPVAAVSFLAPRTLGRAFARRAHALLDAKSTDEARTEADKAVLVDPDGGGGYIAQGRCFLELRNIDEAVVRFTAASAAKYGASDRYSAHLWLASIHADHRSAPDRAQVEYQKAIAEAPPSQRADAHRRYARFLRAQKRVADAERELSTAMQLDASDVEARRELADIHWSARQYERALTHYTILAARAGATVDAATGRDLFRHAYCLGEVNRQADAIAAYQHLIDVRASAGAHNNLGNLLLKRGDAVKAVEHYRAGLAIEPDNDLLNVNLTKGLLDARRFDEARIHAEAALASKPGDGARMFQLARCWGALDKKRQVVEWLRRAVGAGFRDRKAIASDNYLAPFLGNGDVKKLLESLG